MNGESEDRDYQLRVGSDRVSPEVTDLFGRPIIFDVDLTAIGDDRVSGERVYDDGKDRDLGGHSLFTGEIGRVQYRLFGDKPD